MPAPDTTSYSQNLAVGQQLGQSGFGLLHSIIQRAAEHQFAKEQAEKDNEYRNSLLLMDQAREQRLQDEAMEAAALEVARRNADREVLAGLMSFDEQMAQQPQPMAPTPFGVRGPDAGAGAPTPLGPGAGPAAPLSPETLVYASPELRNAYRMGKVGLRDYQNTMAQYEQAIANQGVLARAHPLRKRLEDYGVYVPDQFLPPEEAELTRAMNSERSRTLANLMVQRGHATPEEAELFFKAFENDPASIGELIISREAASAKAAESAKNIDAASQAYRRAGASPAEVDVYRATGGKDRPRIESGGGANQRLRVLDRSIKARKDSMKGQIDPETGKVYNSITGKDNFLLEPWFVTQRDKDAPEIEKRAQELKGWEQEREALLGTMLAGGQNGTAATAAPQDGTISLEDAVAEAEEALAREGNVNPTDEDIEAWIRENYGG